MPWLERQIRIGKDQKQALLGPDSGTAALVEEMRSWHKAIFTLDHSANHHWLDLGLQCFPAGKE